MRKMAEVNWERRKIPAAGLGDIEKIFRQEWEGIG